MLNVHGFFFLPCSPLLVSLYVHPICSIDFVFFGTVLIPKSRVRYSVQVRQSVVAQDETFNVEAFFLATLSLATQTILSMRYVSLHLPPYAKSEHGRPSPFVFQYLLCSVAQYSSFLDTTISHRPMLALEVTSHYALHTLQA